MNEFELKAALSEALASYQAGDLARAESMYRRIVEAIPSATHYTDLGVILESQRRFAEAAIVFQKAIQLDPKHARAHYCYANSLANDGRNEESVAQYSQAISITPAYAEALNGLGCALLSLGRIDEATAQFQAAVQAKPRFDYAHNNLGLALARLGRVEESVRFYQKAIELNPAYFEALDNLGAAYARLGRNREAIDCHQRALQIKPDSAEAHVNLGLTRLKEQDFEGAASALSRAIDLDPRRADAYAGLGAVQYKWRHLAEAASLLEKSIELDASVSDVHFTLAFVHAESGSYEAALPCYRRAISLQPGKAEYHAGYSLALLITGNLSEGWKEYEWRWKTKEARSTVAPAVGGAVEMVQPRKRFDFQHWQGERTKAGRLLLWGEQGLGDEILFSSMIGELLEPGPQVTLETDPRLVQLMQRSFPVAKVVARKNPPLPEPSAFDWQCPLGSLGQWIRPSISSFGHASGYLKPDPSRAKALVERLREKGDERVVGIAWTSSNSLLLSRKGIPLDNWTSILRLPGIRFVDLQYGDTVEERRALESTGLEITHFDDVDLLRDLEGVAALCSACDLVITISNVTAHIAGALGKPTWLLNYYESEWRWLLNRTDSPWYPTMRIFRQPRPGDWKSVIAEVAAALRQKTL